MLKKNCQFHGHNSSIYDVLDVKPHNIIVTSSGDGQIVAWDRNFTSGTGNLLAKTDQSVFAMTYLHEQDMLVLGDFGGDVYWIDLKNKSVIKRVRIHTKAVFNIQQIQDKLYSIAADGQLIEWDMEKMEPLRILVVSNQGLRCMIYAENNFIIGGSDNAIYQIDASNFNVLHHVAKAHDNSVFSLVQSGNNIISGGRDGKLKMWNSALDLLITVDAHWNAVNDLICINEQIIISGSRDRSIRVWQLPNLILLESIKSSQESHLASVNKLLWMKDERKILSVSDDRTIIVWDIAKEKNLLQ